MNAARRVMDVMDGEAWLAKRLGRDGPLIRLFDGVTDHNSRREKLRAAILERGPSRICGHLNGRDITYADAFERLYGERP